MVMKVEDYGLVLLQENFIQFQIHSEKLNRFKINHDQMPRKL